MHERVEVLGVVGAGQMGAGIAEVAAQAGFEVLLMDVSAEALERALGRISSGLDRQVQKGSLTPADRAAIFSRITALQSLTGLSRAEFVIEAIAENEAKKKQLLVAIDGVVSDGAILATNTSSISITRLGAVTSRPESFLGVHFMNPVPVMKLVEIIPGLKTSDHTVQAARTVAERLGKTTIQSDDQPGFVVNRILMPMINEAIFALQEGVATPEHIDAGMRLGTNHPMGPLELADLIGLDTCLAILTVLHAELGADKYRPSPLLRRYVDAGWLGQKCGRGFYRYGA